MKDATGFKVALLPWGDVIEDYLHEIGLSLEDFCQEMTGGWLFGYVEALQHVGIEVVIFCFSSRVERPVRRFHRPTGATLCILPASRAYLWARRPMRDPYGWSLADMFGKAERLQRLGRALLRDIAPYLATPLRHIARELRREQCDAILCQEYESARFDICVALGRLMGLPVFATFQGGNWQRSRLEARVRPITLRACTGLIIAPETEQQRVRRDYDVPPDNISRIYNPLVLSKWEGEGRTEARTALGLPAHVRIAVWHGRVDMHPKGLDVLMQAWQYICSSAAEQEVRLLLVGTGPDARTLRHMITQQQLQSIHWVDEYVLDRAALRRYLSAADVYVLPSRHEGFPVAPLEAMACKLPVVAADAPGIPEMLEGGRAGGVIVPRGNAEALATGLDGLLRDLPRSRSLGAEARSRAELLFSHIAVGKQLRRVLMQSG